jgi:fructose-bisphosphate aldolase, class II
MKTINERVYHAKETGSIVPGFNVFGYEDALAVVRAAERADSPVLLMVNRDARSVMDIRHWGALLESIARRAAVPVGVHLDHSTDAGAILQAMESGFTSVMYDGSHLPIEKNIANSRGIVQLAQQMGVAVEGEVGRVPYEDMEDQEAFLTLPEEARQLYEESGINWLAVSIGNIHRLTDRKVEIDFEQLAAIESVCAAPLVIHGASGISQHDIQRLKETRVAKMNIGTVLRQTFGESLRREFRAMPTAFDRLTLFKNPVKKVEEKAYELITSLQFSERGVENENTPG